MEEGEQTPVSQSQEVKQTTPEPEVEATFEAKLVKIGFSKEDPRTEEEKREGMPRFNNEGLLGVELDVKALVSLLMEEGLTPQQISALEITFRSAGLVNVDLGGAPIGGLSRGTRLEVFTTAPVKVVKEGEEKPEIVKSRFLQYLAAIKEEEILDTLLHELKHYVQHYQGDTTNSWAVKSQEEHDNLPIEKEADEFADAKAKDFAGKLRIYDSSGHFKPETEVIPKGAIYWGPEAVLNRNMVARFWEDSHENSLAYDYFGDYERISKRPTRVNETQLYDFLEKGRRFIGQDVISTYEFNVIASRLAQRFRGANNLLAAEIADSAIIPGVV